MNGGYRLFILPRSSALSSLEAQSIGEFVRQGGILVVDGQAGIFDEHCRRLPKSDLEEVLNGETGRGQVVRMSAFDYDYQRVLGTEALAHKALAKVIADSGIRPGFQVADVSGKAVVGVEIHEFRNGGLTIVGLSNNPPIEVDELGPLKAKSQLV